MPITLTLCIRGIVIRSPKEKRQRQRTGPVFLEKLQDQVGSQSPSLPWVWQRQLRIKDKGQLFLLPRTTQPIPTRSCSLKRKKKSPLTFWQRSREAAACTAGSHLPTLRQDRV